jgi:hypothetical protein
MTDGDCPWEPPLAGSEVEHLLGAMSDGGVRRAARFGVPWITDPLHNLSVMSEWTSLYRQAGAEYGTESTQQLVLLRDGWVADSLEEVERVWWPCIRAEHWFYFKQIPRWVADREPFLADVREEADFRFDTHRIDRLVAGGGRGAAGGGRGAPPSGGAARPGHDVLHLGHHGHAQGLRAQPRGAGPDRRHHPVPAGL